MEEVGENAPLRVCLEETRRKREKLKKEVLHDVLATI